MAEQALGHALPPQAVIHHVNEVRSENRPGNLVICEDRAYHLLLHQRLRAYLATGNAGMRKCYICKEYDLPDRLVTYSNNTSIFHRACSRRGA